MDNELINKDEIPIEIPTPKQKRKPYVLKIKRKEKYEYTLSDEQKARQKECIKLRNQRIKDAMEFIKNNKIDIYSPVIDNPVKPEPPITIVEQTTPEPVVAKSSFKYEYITPTDDDDDILSKFKPEVVSQLKHIKSNYNSSYYKQVLSIAMVDKNNYK